MTRDDIQHSVVGGVLCFQTVQTTAKKINIRCGLSTPLPTKTLRETSNMQPAFCGSRVTRLSYVRGSRQFPNTFNLRISVRVDDFFSNSLNLTRIVAFGKQHLGYNVIRHVAWEIIVFWKLFSRRRDTTVAW